MIIRSILGKLWLSMIVLVIVVMVLLGFFLSQFFEDFYFTVKSQELAKNGVKIADMIAASPGPIDLESELYNISKYIDAKVVITDKAGLVKVNTLNDSSLHKGTKLPYPDVEKILQGKIVAQRGTYPGMTATVLSVGVPIKINNSVIGAVFLHAPVEPVTQTVRTVQKTILYLAIGTIFLATILGFIFSKTITKPVLDMNRVAMEMAKGNFNEKVTLETEDELGLLGNTLNYLSSELQKSMDALSNEKDQLANILTSMTDAVITIDISGQILLMNPPAQKLFRHPAVAAKQHIGDLPVVPVLKEKFDAALRHKDYTKSDITVDDSIFNLSMAPFRHSRGEVRGIVAVLHDVTQEKRLESLRREFVANVSHELRSPLSLLQGYVEALADGLAEDEEQKQRYLNIVLDETLRLRRLVNDVLDLSQLETGNMKMKTEPISVPDLVHRVTERFEPLFEEQQKIMQVTLADSLPMISGDEDKLQQVLINLLDNAVKYTPEHGTVQITAEFDRDFVVISVADTGPGIPLDELNHVWERFYKINKARTREDIGGTGLGLAIAKNIVLAHHGRVGVTSEPGRGAQFSFSIPAANYSHLPLPI